jgi:hypothetical protein
LSKKPVKSRKTGARHHLKIKSAQTKMRRCLGTGCNKLFESKDFGNRFCKTCATRNASDAMPVHKTKLNIKNDDDNDKGA